MRKKLGGFVIPVEHSRTKHVNYSVIVHNCQNKPTNYGNPGFQKGQASSKFSYHAALDDSIKLPHPFRSAEVCARPGATERGLIAFRLFRASGSSLRPLVPQCPLPDWQPEWEHNPPLPKPSLSVPSIPQYPRLVSHQSQLYGLQLAVS